MAPMPRLKFVQVRDAALLVGGLALLGYETVGAAEPRWLLVTVAAAMIGLPATFIADRWFVGSQQPPPPGGSAAGPPTPGSTEQEQAP